MRARDKRTVTEKHRVLMFYRLKKIKENVGGVERVERPRNLKNLKSYNRTESNQLTIYKRGRGFSRVIDILIR